MDFREKIEQGKFVRCMETIPPKGKDLEKVLTNLKPFKERVDASTVVDSPLGIARMHPLPVCYKIQEELELETIMHFTCRDRNKLEIEAQLLAASVFEVSNILALTGDPTKSGKPVFEFNSIELIGFIRKLNEKYNTDFFVGAGLNINANLEKEMEKTSKKIEAGAKFFITQPCFDAKKINDFEINIPIITGVLLLSDRKTAEFFDKIPGIRIPKSLFEIIDDRSKTIEYYKRLIHDLEQATNGICFMPIKNYNMINELL